MASLCIATATYRDFEGVWSTLQSFRMNPHCRGVQFVVVDNFGCDDTRALCEGWNAAKYVRYTEKVGTAAPRDLIFEVADADFVMVVDCHVQLADEPMARLRQLIDANPDCDDLLQGPMIYDDCMSFATHFHPEWRGGMWGTWAADERGIDPDGPPFEIPMQGLGLFVARREAWPGFHPKMRGFGGEEGYIHAKYKARGDRTLCLPFLRWCHRFQKVGKSSTYPNLTTDRVFNYYLGHAEVGFPLEPITQHFGGPGGIDAQTLARLQASALKALRESA